MDAAPQKYVCCADGHAIHEMTLMTVIILFLTIRLGASLMESPSWDLIDGTLGLAFLYTSVRWLVNFRLFPDEGVAHVARRAGASVAG